MWPTRVWWAGKKLIGFFSPEAQKKEALGDLGSPRKYRVDIPNGKKELENWIGPAGGLGVEELVGDRKCEVRFADVTKEGNRRP